MKEAGGLRPPASVRSSPRGAARSDTCTPLRAAQCSERRASPPLTAVSTAWSSSPGGEGPSATPRGAARGKGVRPKASQSAKDFLIELPERDTRAEVGSIGPLACKACSDGVTMQVPTVDQLIPVLQTAIGPVILISGVGLPLLTMTNRLGRAIDRARILAGEIQNADDVKRVKIAGQLQILWRGARLIRLAIALASMTALWQIETAWPIAMLFVACMACLIGSLLVFIHDINQSLAALKLELALEGVGES